MAVKKRHALLIILPRAFPAKIGAAPVQPLKRWDKTRSFAETWEAIWTGWFLKFFLWIFKKIFEFSEDFRENIKDFSAKYVFKTQKGTVAETVRFKNSVMEIDHENKDDHPNVTVIFKDADVLRRYLFSMGKGQDILKSILANHVQLDGNWNYVYKFLFMVSDLRQRMWFL